MPLVVDPVLRASTGALLLDPEALEVLIERLLPLRDGGHAESWGGASAGGERRGPPRARSADRRQGCESSPDHGRGRQRRQICSLTAPPITRSRSAGSPAPPRTGPAAPTRPRSPPSWRGERHSSTQPVVLQQSPPRRSNMGWMGSAPARAGRCRSDLRSQPARAHQVDEHAQADEVDQEEERTDVEPVPEIETAERREGLDRRDARRVKTLASILRSPRRRADRRGWERRQADCGWGLRSGRAPGVTAAGRPTRLRGGAGGGSGMGSGPGSRAPEAEYRGGRRRRVLFWRWRRRRGWRGGRRRRWSDVRVGSRRQWSCPSASPRSRSPTRQRALERPQ